MGYYTGMSFNNNQFKVRWTDKEGTQREKIYSDYSQARKAYKWLNDNGAVADMAIIKRIKISDEDNSSSIFPGKKVQ